MGFLAMIDSSVHVSLGWVVVVGRVDAMAARLMDGALVGWIWSSCQWVDLVLWGVVVESLECWVWRLQALLAVSCCHTIN